MRAGQPRVDACLGCDPGDARLFIAAPQDRRTKLVWLFACGSFGLLGVLGRCLAPLDAQAGNVFSQFVPRRLAQVSECVPLIRHRFLVSPVAGLSFSKGTRNS